MRAAFQYSFSHAGMRGLFCQDLTTTLPGLLRCSRLFCGYSGERAALEILVFTVLSEIREIVSMSLSFVVEAVMMLPSRRETIYTGPLPSRIQMSL